MSQIAYLIAAIAIAGLITLLLRAVPFAILGKLKKSTLVKRLGEWMPAGILCILAVVIFRSQLIDRPEHFWAAVISIAVTIATHLLSRRKALLSIAVGTTCYVLLVNVVPIS